jgi:hypothetical protein
MGSYTGCDAIVIEKYEELRRNIVEKSTNRAIGFATFVRHGLFAWGLFLKESHSKIEGDKKSDFKLGSEHTLNNPMISVLVSMIDSIQEIYL